MKKMFFLLINVFVGFNLYSASSAKKIKEAKFFIIKIEAKNQKEEAKITEIIAQRDQFFVSFNSADVEEMQNLPGNELLENSLSFNRDIILPITINGIKIRNVQLSKSVDKPCYFMMYFDIKPGRRYIIRLKNDYENPSKAFCYPEENNAVRIDTIGSPFCIQEIDLNVLENQKKIKDQLDQALPDLLPDLRQIISEYLY